jgi:hypothetical protein
MEGQDMLRIIVVSVLLSVVLGGCVDMAEVESMRNEAAGLRDELRAQSAAWERRLGEIPARDPMRPEAEAALAAARAKGAAIDAALKSADAALGHAQNKDEPLTQTVDALSPWVPAPARAPLLLGAALVASLLRASALKRGLASVAKGLDKAMEEDDLFRARFKAHAGTFRTIQTRTAKRVVDETTGRRPMVRLPV